MVQISEHGPILHTNRKIYHKSLHQQSCGDYKQERTIA